jgi:hypothetical protein
MLLVLPMLYHHTIAYNTCAHCKTHTILDLLSLMHPL